MYRDRYFKREYFDGLDRINLRLKEVYPNNTPSLGIIKLSIILCLLNLTFSRGEFFLVVSSFGTWSARRRCDWRLLHSATRAKSGALLRFIAAGRRNCGWVWATVARNFTLMSYLSSLRRFLEISEIVYFLIQVQAIFWLVRKWTPLPFPFRQLLIRALEWIHPWSGEYRDRALLRIRAFVIGCKIF